MVIPHNYYDSSWFCRQRSGWCRLATCCSPKGITASYASRQPLHDRLRRCGPVRLVHTWPLLGRGSTPWVPLRGCTPAVHCGYTGHPPCTPAAVPPARYRYSTSRPAVRERCLATFRTCEPAAWYTHCVTDPLVNPCVTGPSTKRNLIGTDCSPPTADLPYTVVHRQ